MPGSGATANREEWDAYSRRAPRSEQDGDQAIERALGGTLVELNQGARSSGHFFAPRTIADQSDPRLPKPAAVSNLNGSACSEKIGGHLAEVLHRRSEDRGLAEPGGFENVVPAGGYQRSADKYSVGQTVKSSQFTERVEQKNIRIGAERLRERERAAADDFPSAADGQFGGGVKVVGLARCQDQKRAPPFSLHYIEC